MVPMTTSICPKFKSLTLILPSKMKNVVFSYNFDYIVQCEASLVLMVMSIFIYNIYHSQLSCKSIIVFIYSPL